MSPRRQSSAADPSTFGALVISLDFELRWGVREKSPVDGPYTQNILGARVAVPRMLALFDEFGVRATWATVGFLFAEDRRELDRRRPSVLPGYADRTLSPYGERIGAGEGDDPLHFAPSLVDAIRRAPGQELATHTYSHYYCQEPGQTAEAFDADLGAACAIAAARGDRLTSIVFPRNQYNPEYDPVLVAHGITAFRGNPRTWMWRFEGAAEGASRGRRFARLVDAYVGGAGGALTRWEDMMQPNGLADVRASAFLRPFSPRLRRLEPLRVARLRRLVREAARSGRIFHLWWHPHNFGRHLDQNLDVLRQVLMEFARCREAFGMQSLAMRDVADAARARFCARAPRSPLASAPEPAVL
jgi:peptidoglycan/xylan/chitin deacetylase (PgdA/CDA1 family)